jgi:hypothetical protein
VKAPAIRAGPNGIRLCQQVRFPSYRGDIAFKGGAVAETRRKFDQDFKEGAVRLVREGALACPGCGETGLRRRADQPEMVWRWNGDSHRLLLPRRLWAPAHPPIDGPARVSPGQRGDRGMAPPR